MTERCEEKKNRVQVKICGEDYMLKSTATPEYLRRLAAEVHQRMQIIGSMHNRQGSGRLAVLTALNLADELFRLRQDMQRLEVLLAQKNQQC